MTPAGPSVTTSGPSATTYERECRIASECVLLDAVANPDLPQYSGKAMAVRALTLTPSG